MRARDDTISYSDVRSGTINYCKVRDMDRGRTESRAVAGSKDHFGHVFGRD